MSIPSEIRVVCPHCECQKEYIFIGPGKEAVTCMECSKTFSFLLARMRAKRSRGNRERNRREFDIRVILSEGSEHFFQFVKAGYDDIELRAKDLVVFIYLADELSIVLNDDISRYTKIKKPQVSTCFIATHIYGENSSEVIFLRNWRDEKLIPSKVGRKFVDIYYLLSPKIVNLSKKHKSVKQIATFATGIFLGIVGFKKVSLEKVMS